MLARPLAASRACTTAQSLAQPKAPCPSRWVGCAPAWPARTTRSRRPPTSTISPRGGWDGGWAAATDMASVGLLHELLRPPRAALAGEHPTGIFARQLGDLIQPLHLFV